MMTSCRVCNLDPRLFGRKEIKKNQIVRTKGKGENMHGILWRDLKNITIWKN